MFGANLFSALGAANGVQTAGETGNIRVVAFDAPGSIVDNISSGLVDMAIAQHPAEIGYYGVMSAYAHLTGNSIPVSPSAPASPSSTPPTWPTPTSPSTSTRNNRRGDGGPAPIVGRRFLR